MAERVNWESFAGRLYDYDVINVTVESGVVSQDVVDFRLVAGEGITWWKGLYVPDGLGSAWEIWTEDGRTSDSVSLWAHQVDNGQDVEFRKGKFLKWHTGMYALGDLERLAGGSRVTFQWAQDEDPEHSAWRTESHIDLPFRDGRFRVTAGQTFQARVTYWNFSGTVLWTSDARYKLGSVTPLNNTTWGLSRVELPYRSRVIEFVINARAPATPGEYPFQWRMVQENVKWFGDVFGPSVIVVEPPPPPITGEVNVRLVRQGPAALTYDAAAPDPSVTPTYPTARQVLIESVVNASEHRLFLAHRDRQLQQTKYQLIEPYGLVTAPFNGLEVEGLWRAEYRGAAAPPVDLMITVSWRAA